jgi:hypothetical protein
MASGPSGQQAAATPSADPSSLRCPSSSPERRNLLSGMPDRGAALQAQRANLDRFVADHQAEFDAMPYMPWTEVPAHHHFHQHEHSVTAASVARGIRGVYLKHALRIGDKHEIPLFYYPGLLLTHQLHTLFSEEYYCPTSLEIPVLDYTDEDGSAVKMMIIGDPTSTGALINDARKSKLTGQRVHVMRKTARLDAMV